MHRAGAVIALLVSLVATAVPCAGWGQSPEARRDCCDQCPGEMHESSTGGVSQATADTCCAASEERRQQSQSQSPAASIAMAVAPATRVTPSLVPVALTRARTVRVTAAARSTPRHVLFAVFLV